MEGCRLQGHVMVGLKFNAKSTNEAFANKRTEMYWNMSRWVKNGGALPRIPGLAKQLCATNYTIHKDKMIAEPKEIVKVKLENVSPDMADSLVCTFATPDKQSSKMPAESGFATGQMAGFGDENPLSGFFKRSEAKNTGMKGFGGGYGH
jgi:hypothetical protein